MGRRNDALSGKNRIQHKPVTFQQVDRENHWDDYIILQVRKQQQR